MADVHGLCDSCGKESHPTQYTYQCQIKIKKNGHIPVCLVPSILHRMRKLSHITHMYYHHILSLFLYMGFRPMLGVVGKPWHVHFGPYQPLQGAAEEMLCLRQGHCYWDRTLNAWCDER